jgi:hypothetical protein
MFAAASGYLILAPERDHGDLREIHAHLESLSSRDALLFLDLV